MRSFSDAIHRLLPGNQSCLIALLAASLSIQARAQSSTPAESAAQTELVALTSLMKRVEAECPRPAKVSATQVHGNGYWEQLDMDVVSYGLLRRMLPTLHRANSELIRYWVARAGDPRRVEDPARGFGTEFKIEEAYGYRFADGMCEAIASSSALAPWADELKTASTAFVTEMRQADRIASGYWSLNEEANNALRRALDIEGKRRNLIKVIQEILKTAGDLDVDHNPACKPLYLFLARSIDASWSASGEDRARKVSVAGDLRKVYSEATKPPAEVTAHIEKLEAIYTKLAGVKLELLERALSPGQTPMTFLEQDAQEFIDTQIEFDRALVSALESAEVRSDPAWARALNGLYPVWTSLDRYNDFLAASFSRGVYSVSLLTEIAQMGLMSESWDGGSFDSATGRSISTFTVQRAGQTVDLLSKFQEAGLKQNAADGQLFAALEVDDEGLPVWTRFNWIVWKWITAGDLDDLNVDGRIVEGLGRRWLLPAGSSVKSIGSFKDVIAADGREVVLAFDLAGAGKRKAPK